MDIEYELACCFDFVFEVFFGAVFSIMDGIVVFGFFLRFEDVGLGIFV